MNILVVDDQADIREIVVFALNHEFKAEVVSAMSGNKAIDLLKKMPFDLVVCDYNMPDGNGLLVHDFVKEECPNTKFVFCSSEAEDILDKATNVFFHIKKPDIFAYIRRLKSKMHEMNKIAEDAESEYTELSLNLVLKLSPIPFDVYLKLSDNNFVKYYSETELIQYVDVISIKAKGAKSLFVKCEDMTKARQRMVELLGSKLEEVGDKVIVNHLLNAQEVILHYLREFGYDQKIQEMTLKNVQTTFQVIHKEKDLEQCLVKLLELGSYSRKLYAVTICFSSVILKSLNLLNEQTLTKMIMAIYFQDIYVIGEDQLSLYTKHDCKRMSWKKPQDEEYYLQHPQRAQELVKNFNSIPQDVDKMIIESHELPSGQGFPRGLSGNQISPLSCVLIMANLLAREFLRVGAVFDTEGFLRSINQNHHLDQGHFKKVYDASLSIDFFPSLS